VLVSPGNQFRIEGSNSNVNVSVFANGKTVIFSGYTLLLTSNMVWDGTYWNASCTVTSGGSVPSDIRLYGYEMASAQIITNTSTQVDALEVTASGVNVEGTLAAPNLSAETALIGDVYIDSNIITPAPALNYYGLPGEAQPLVVNGDLEVIGNITAANIVNKTVRTYSSAPGGVVEFDLRVYDVLRSAGGVGAHNLDIIMPNDAWVDEVYDEYYSQFGPVIGGYIQAQYFPRQDNLPSSIKLNGINTYIAWAGFDGAAYIEGSLPSFSRTPTLITFHVVKASQFGGAQITATYV
jgi:hypothetical protein